MALKFLNKKGWHTGSLRNIENVWKAEQKHDAEQKKLEELRKQIHEEREKSEYRQLQEAAGLIPRQERLDFLYESGLGVGKGNSEGFKALQEQPPAGAPSSAAESSSSKAAVPGALFEEKEKPQSANDAWRKLHSDPLLLIRQREQEALARIKNNPIRMAMIRKSVESEKKREDKEHKKKKKKHKRDKSKSKVEDASKSQPDSDNSSGYEARRRRDYPVEWKRRSSRDTKENGRNDNMGDTRIANNAVEQHEKPSERHEKQLSTRSAHCDERSNEDYKSVRHKRSEQSKSSSKHRSADKYDGQHKHKVSGRRENDAKMTHSSAANQLPATNKETYPKNAAQQNSGYNRRHGVPKMTEEEREARLREMQMDAELHEEQRWKRLKTATAADVLEAAQAATSCGKNFLDAAQKSVYGMEKGGSTTIEESVRRRTYYSQGQSAHDSNAFRR